MRWKHGGSDSDAKIRPTQSQLIIIKPAFMTLEEFTARALKSDLDKARVLSGRPSSYRNIIKIIISAATTYLIVISFAITLQERQRGRERGVQETVVNTWHDQRRKVAPSNKLTIYPFPELHLLLACNFIKSGEKTPVSSLPNNYTRTSTTTEHNID